MGAWAVRASGLEERVEMTTSQFGTLVAWRLRRRKSFRDFNLESILCGHVAKCAGRPLAPFRQARQLAESQKTRESSIFSPHPSRPPIQLAERVYFLRNTHILAIGQCHL